MNKYTITGETNKSKHGGYKPKLITEEHYSFLRELLEEDCFITLEHMQEQLEVVDGLRVGLSTICNRMAGFYFSFKVVDLPPQVIEDTDMMKIQRKEYSHWLAKMNMMGRNLVYLDEIGFMVNSRVIRGREKNEEAGRNSSTTPRSKKMSFIGAIHTSGLVHHELLEAHARGEQYRHYIHQLCEALLLRQIAKPILIMNGLGFPYTDTVIQEIIALGLEYKVLPECSPFCNPMADVFPQWKQNVRFQKPGNYQELIVSMSNVKNFITVDDCSKAITRADHYCKSCIEGKDHPNEEIF